MSDYENPLGNINIDEDGIAPENTEPQRFSGIALRVVRSPKGIPVLAFDGNGRVVFQSMDYDHVVLDWDTSDSLLEQLSQAVEHRQADETDPDVIVERDEQGEVTRLVCPKCGKDDIREHDGCERWNPIEIIEGTLAVSQLDADFATIGFICADCVTELGAPQAIYELLNWG